MPHLPLIRKTTPYRCWYVLTNGLLEYRAGRLSEAIELLSQVDTDIYPSALAAAAATLAMAYNTLGDHEAATAQLNHARAMTTHRWNDPALPIGNWRNWLMANLLL